MKKTDDRVSKHFFAANKFYDRKWTLYYIHPPRSTGKGPITLLPVSEVQDLVDEISSTFKIALQLPSAPFTLEFYKDGTPLPQFLGFSKSREDFDRLTENIPSPRSGYGECPAVASQQLRNAFKASHEKVTSVVLASRKKGSASKHKARNLLEEFEESHNQLKRLQRYFGLRPSVSTSNQFRTLPNMEMQRDEWIQQVSNGIFVSFLNIDEKAQHPFDQEPIIISIDVESYERNHSLITEIGISTLDTLDLVDIPPNKDGTDWIKHIRSRHFRIRGRESLVNKDFCRGNPESFQFGQSEFVRLDAIADTIDSCFQHPFSIQHKQAGPNPPAFYTNSQPTSSDPTPPPTQHGPRTRNIVLIGHDTTTDTTSLQTLNVQSLNPISPTTNPILTTLDTAKLYQRLTSSPQPRNLGHICANLGIDAWFTHNAGNDARYTLEALVKIGIRARLDEDEKQRLKDPESRGIVVDEVEMESMRRSDERLELARQMAVRDAVEEKERKERAKRDEEVLEQRVREWQDGGDTRDVKW